MRQGEINWEICHFCGRQSRQKAFALCQKCSEGAFILSVPLCLDCEEALYRGEDPHVFGHCHLCGAETPRGRGVLPDVCNCGEGGVEVCHLCWIDLITGQGRPCPEEK